MNFIEYIKIVKKNLLFMLKKIKKVTMINCDKIVKIKL